MVLQWPFDLVDGEVPHENRGAFWDPEGNILLIAGVHAYQVKKVDLIANSRILANPASAAEIYPDHQGRQVLRVDGSAEAMDKMLGWIYNPASVKQNEARDIKALCRFVNLTSSYNPKGTRTMALHILTPHYEQRFISYATWDGLTEFPRPDDTIAAANAARNLSAFSLLPMTLLDSSLFASEKNLLGLSHSQDAAACNMLRTLHANLARDLSALLLHFDKGRPMLARTRCCNLQSLHDRVFGILYDAKAKDTLTYPTDRRNVLTLMHAIRAHPARVEDGGSQTCKLCRDELSREAMALYRHWWEDVARCIGLSGWHDVHLKEDALDWNGAVAEDQGWGLDGLLSTVLRSATRWWSGW